MRDPDLVRAPGLDPGLHGGARVVHVDVHVPQSVAAADHQRVAERAEPPAQRGQGLVGCVEQVDDLEGGVAGAGRPDVHLAALDGPEVAAQRDRAHRLLPGDGVGERAEDGDQPAPAGVHHPVLGQHGELFGGVPQRVPGGPVGGVGDLREPVPGPDGLPGGDPGDGQQGALDGLRDGLVGGVGGPLQGGPQLVGAAALGEHLGGAAQPLGEDHAGVAAGADQRAAGHRPDRVGQAGGGSAAGSAKRLSTSAAADSTVR